MKTKIVILATVAALVQGCGGFMGSEELIQSQLNEVSSGDKTTGEGRPTCEIDFSDYQLDTQLMAFEITDASNASFGFNLFSGFLRALGISLKSETGKMTMSMHFSESLQPQQTVANVMGEGESKKTDFSMNLDLLKLAIDVGYYYQTPVSKLTEKTLESSLTNLNTAMSRIETPWSSRVVYMYGEQDQVIIPAGKIAGIQSGDIFNIYNVDYAWRNEPCTSELLLERKTNPLPVATAIVMQVEKNASLLKIVEVRTDEAIAYGAKVEIAHLIPAANGAARNLLRSVRLRNFKSEPIRITDGTKVDFSLYMAEQTQSLLNRHGYYPRK